MNNQAEQGFEEIESAEEKVAGLKETVAVVGDVVLEAANAVSAGDDDDIERREVEREIDFKLSEEEVAQFARKAAEVEQEAAKIMIEFESVKKDWKAKLKVHESERLNLMSMIRDGFQKRKVKCLEQKDFKTNTVFYIYGGSIMDERALTVDERQSALAMSGFGHSPVVAPSSEDEAMANVPLSQDEQSREMRDVIRDETRAATKHSSLDGPMY